MKKLGKKITHTPMCMFERERKSVETYTIKYQLCLFLGGRITGTLNFLLVLFIYFIPQK